MQLGAGADDPDRAEHRETDRLARLRPHTGNGNRPIRHRSLRPQAQGRDRVSARDQATLHSSRSSATPRRARGGRRRNDVQQAGKKSRSPGGVAGRDDRPWCVPIAPSSVLPPTRAEPLRRRTPPWVAPPCASSSSARASPVWPWPGRCAWRGSGPTSPRSCPPPSSSDTGLYLPGNAARALRRLDLRRPGPPARPGDPPAALPRRRRRAALRGRPRRPLGRRRASAGRCPAPNCTGCCSPGPAAPSGTAPRSAPSSCGRAASPSASPTAPAPSTTW